MIWFSFCVTFAEFISPLRLPKTEAGGEGEYYCNYSLRQNVTFFFLSVCFHSTIDSKIAIEEGRVEGL